MQARPNHESPGPSSSLVPSRPEVGPTNSALPHPQPATRKEKGGAMVLRRNRARRVLLRTGDDHAPGARGPVESRNFLPWRSNHGTAERLDKLFPQVFLACCCNSTRMLGRAPLLSRQEPPVAEPYRGWRGRMAEMTLLPDIRSKHPKQAGTTGRRPPESLSITRPRALPL